MKTIQYTLLVLLACITFSGCQEVEDPVNNIPTVTTDIVVKFFTENAYVSGTVSSRAECYFLVSTSEDLADARQVKAYGSVPNFSAEVGDLKPGTTYYCALCATDGRSVVKGNVQSFKTNSYLSIGSVENGDAKAEIIGTYLANEKQELVSSYYGNMKTTYKSQRWNLPFDVTLTDAPYTVYAYSPYSNKNTNETLDGVYVWTGGTNDFFYGKSGVVNSSNPAANIVMQSALAHLSFSISTDNEAISIASINLRNTHSTPEALSIVGYMNVATGMITPRTDYKHDGIVVPLKLLIKKGATEEVSMFVIPTSFEAGEIVFRVNLGNQYIDVPLSAATWEKGKKYEIAVKVNVKAKEAKVGDFYYSDGIWSSERIASKSCVGIVFALSKESGGAIDATLSSSMHGRIVALKDAGTSKWGEWTTQVADALIFSGLYGSGTDYGYLPIDGKDKYSEKADYGHIPYNYEKWLEKPGANSNYKDYALCNYEGASFSRRLVNGGNAASLCSSYKEGGLSWFLPSVGEMARLSLACGYGKISMNQQLGFIGLNGYYWTSCAVSPSMAWGFASDVCLFNWHELPVKLNVRPIAAF